MTIYLIRHSESEGNIDPSTIGRVGNANLKITDHGRVQTEALAAFIWTELQSRMKNWPRFWVSSMERPQQTFSGVMSLAPSDAFPGKPELFEDDNLVEQDFGLLPYLLTAKDHPALANYNSEDISKAVTLIQTFSRHMYGHQKFLARPPLGESPQDVCGRVSHFINTLRRDIVDDDVTDHVIFTHGAVIKAFIKEMHHLPMRAWDQIATPGNADVFRVELTDARKLGRIRKIYDGEKMTAADIDPCENIRPLSLEDLTPWPPQPRKN